MAENANEPAKLFIKYQDGYWIEANAIQIKKYEDFKSNPRKSSDFIKYKTGVNQDSPNTSTPYLKIKNGDGWSDIMFTAFYRKSKSNPKLYVLDKKLNISRRNPTSQVDSHKGTSLNATFKKSQPININRIELNNTSKIKEIVEFGLTKWLEDADYKAVLKLIMAYNIIIDKVLSQLSKGKKMNDYIWWICPTEKPGANDPLKTYVTKETYIFFLNKIDIIKWIQVIKILVDDEKSANRKIPHIDFGRIVFFKEWWVDKILDYIVKMYTNCKYSDELRELIKELTYK
jgi:hypothetical protein